MWENENRQAITQGSGVLNESSQADAMESGLASSISGTRVSEFTPTLTEYNFKPEPENDQNNQVNCYFVYFYLISA